MVNKNQFSIKNTKKVLHKVGKRWLVISALVLGLIAGGSAVVNTNAVQANADTTTSAVKASKQLSTNSVSNSNETNTNHKLLSTPTNTQTNLNNVHANSGVNDLASLASEANTNHTTSAYDNLFDLANNVKSYFNGMKFGSDTASNYDTSTWMGTLNQVNSDVNAINQNGSNPTLNTLNRTLNKGTHYLENGNVGPYRVPNIVNTNMTVLGHHFDSFANNSYNLATLSNVLTNNSDASNIMHMKQATNDNPASDARYSKLAEDLLHGTFESHFGKNNVNKANDAVQGLNIIAQNNNLSNQYSDFLTNAKKLPNENGKDLASTLNALSHDAKGIAAGIVDKMSATNPQGAKLIAHTLNENANDAHTKATTIMNKINSQSSKSSSASSASSASSSHASSTASSANSKSNSTSSSDNVRPHSSANTSNSTSASSTSTDNSNNNSNASSTNNSDNNSNTSSASTSSATSSSAFVPSFIPANSTADIIPDITPINFNNSTINSASVNSSSVNSNNNSVSVSTSPIEKSQIAINSQPSHYHFEPMDYKRNSFNLNQLKRHIITTNYDAIIASNKYAKLNYVHGVQRLLTKYYHAVKAVHDYKSVNNLRTVQRVNKQFNRAEKILKHAHTRRAKRYAQRNLIRNENKFIVAVKNAFAVRHISIHHKNMSYNDKLYTALQHAKVNIFKAQRKLHHVHSKRNKVIAHKHLTKAVVYYDKLAKRYDTSILNGIKHSMKVDQRNLHHAHGWRAKKNIRTNLKALQRSYKQVSHDLKTFNKSHRHSVRKHHVKRHVRSHKRHTKRDHHKASHRRK